MAKKRGPARSFTCHFCGEEVLRIESHCFRNMRYCNSCWDFYQKLWKNNIDNWVESYGDNIKSLDYYPQLQGKGYYATSDGNIWSTKHIYRPRGIGDFRTFYLPQPIKYPVPEKPIFHYGDKRNGIFIKNIIYTLFKEPFTSDYIIVNKDYDIYNNAVDNLIKFPRSYYINNGYYAVKKGKTIAEALTLEGLSRILHLSGARLSYLAKTGEKSKNGIYVKRK